MLFAPPPLPDLDQAAPAAISVRVERGRRLLVFGSAVQNVGAGLLVVEGERRGRSMAAWQLVGGRRVRVGRLVCVRAETHAHWHYVGFERYELRTPRPSRGKVRPELRTLERPRLCADRAPWPARPAPRALSRP